MPQHYKIVCCDCRWPELKQRQENNCEAKAFTPAKRKIMLTAAHYFHHLASHWERGRCNMSSVKATVVAAKEKRKLARKTERLLRANRIRIVAFHSPTEAMIIDENVHPLQRIWCLFEVYHTIQFSQSGDHFQGFIFKRRAEGQGRDGKSRYYIRLFYNVAWITP